MKLIDSHVHFWNPDQLNYDWLKGIDALNRAFLPADYMSAHDTHTVEGIVFVEASADAPLEEVQWIETLDAPIKFGATSPLVAFLSLETNFTEGPLASTGSS